MLDETLLRHLSTKSIRRLLRTGKPFLLTISGSSMLPYLTPGDQVVVNPNVKNLKENDLVLIDWGSRFVVHRLTNLSTMQTKGDNLSMCDPSGLPLLGICQKVTDNHKKLE